MVYLLQIINYYFQKYQNYGGNLCTTFSRNIKKSYKKCIDYLFI